MPPADRISEGLGRVAGELAELATLAARPRTLETHAEAVSAWSVGQHVEHLALSDALILDGLERLAADPAAGTPGGPNLLGRICLATGWIPRGRGRAPAGTLPAGAEPAEILERLRALEQGFRALAGAAAAIAGSPATVPHPVFGPLDAARWLRFTTIHHRHHRKIIDAILRAA